MKEVFKEFLFKKHILVADPAGTAKTNAEDRFCLLVALSGKYGIRITEGADLVCEQLLLDAARNLGEYVPEPFYRGFPESVRRLTREQKLFDQLYHYTQTYGLGWFDNVGHSAVEEFYGRLQFTEKTEAKSFRILTEEKAEEELKGCLKDLFSGSRPMNIDQRIVAEEAVKEYGKDVLPERIPCKRTAAELLYATKNVTLFCKSLRLPDVIKVLDYIQYEVYSSENLKKLNLRNQDRKLLTKLIDACFESMPYDGMSEDIFECFEKKAVWKGLLHHIHYKPKTEHAQRFLKAIRGSGNLSAYSTFERLMAETEFPDHCAKAASALQSRKGTGAVIRNLNYILSRCEDAEEADKVIKTLGTDADSAILIQMMMQYHGYLEEGSRTFLFTRNNRMRFHRETDEERRKRKSFVKADIREAAYRAMENLLESKLSGKLGGKKVYIDPGMVKIAVPIQMSTGTSGFGVLPSGSRIPIPEGKKIRAFTYWEKVNDIDLSCFGLSEKGETREFSWRTMWREDGEQSIAFSGDETSGYNGGSEYFDIDLEKAAEEYPGFRYIVFCDNIYSNSGSTHFSDCMATAGFMIRDSEDSGEVFEPKTVKTSFRLSGDSSYSWMFAIDLKTREMVWLNICRSGNHAVAGNTAVDAVMKWLDATEVFNVHRLYHVCSWERTGSMDNADIVVTADENYQGREGQEVVHSWDIEKMLRLLQQ